MTAATQGQPDEPTVRMVQLPLCDPCIDGQGDECHTPGCTFFLFAPPERSIRDFTAAAAQEPKPAPELTAAMRETRQLRNIIGTLIDLFDEPDHRNMRHASVTKSTLTRYAAEAGVKP